MISARLRNGVALDHDDELMRTLVSAGVPCNTAGKDPYCRIGLLDTKGHAYRIIIAYSPAECDLIKNSLHGAGLAEVGPAANGFDCVYAATVLAFASFRGPHP